jgi:thioredoxin-like negative regulator of GroEL
MSFKALTIFLFILLFSVCVNGQTEETSIKWQTNYKTALELAKESGKPVLMDFQAKWCKPCLAMEKNLWSKPEVVKLSEDFVFVLIDYDRDYEVVSRFRVNSIPHVVVADPWGNMLGFHHGFGNNSIEAIIQLIKDTPKEFSEIKDAFALLLNDKDNTSALIKIGDFYSRKKSYHLSNTFFRRALKTKAGDGRKKEDILVALGLNYLQIRDFDEAIRILETSLKEFPTGQKNEPAFFGLVMANIYRKRNDAAEKVLEQMKAKFPDSQSVLQAEQNLQQAKTQSN